MSHLLDLVVADQDTASAVFEIAFGHIGEFGFDVGADVFGEDFGEPTRGVGGWIVRSIGFDTQRDRCVVVLFGECKGDLVNGVTAEGFVDLLEVASAKIMEFLEPDFFGDFDGEVAFGKGGGTGDGGNLLASDIDPSPIDKGFGGLCGGSVLLDSRFLEGLLEDGSDALGGG